MATARSLKAHGKKAAREAAYSPLMDRLARLGYGVKGAIYIIMGLLAIQGALGKSKTPADQLGAIREFSTLPYAKVLLWVILLGLIAYSLWSLIRAFLDPFHKGTDMQGLIARGGYLISAMTYAFFVIPTLDLIRGRAGGDQTSQTQESIAALMSLPFGRILIGLLGVAGIVAGLYQMNMGINSKFEQQFEPYALSPRQLRIAKQTGRFGTVARGVVFAIVGFFLFLAAYFANPGHARSFDGALDFLAGQPYGLWLMGIIAAGLIAFGVYALISAAWFRLKDTKR